MQIMPSGGAWTNPAALNQQVLGDSKLSGTLKDVAKTAEPVTPLEQTGKAADRDAQERYDGPQHENGAHPSDDASSTSSEENSMLVLPANDDLEPGTLDLIG